MSINLLLQALALAAATALVVYLSFHGLYALMIFLT